MATYYVRGATGSNANTGADWNNAKQTVAGALALATSISVFHVIVVDNGETFTANAAITWTPTAGTTVAIYGVTRSGTSGYTYDPGVRAIEYVGAAATAAFTVNGAANCTMYVKAMVLYGGIANNAANVVTIFPTLSINSQIEFHDCTLIVDSANASTAVNLGATASASSRGMSIKLFNTGIQMSGNRGGTGILIGECDLEMVDPHIIFAGSTKPGTIFAIANAVDTANVVIRDGTINYMDYSALLSLNNMTSSKLLFKNLVFDSAIGWSGLWPGGSASFTIRNCTYPPTVYGLLHHNGFGSAQTTELSVVTDSASEALFNGERVSWLLSNGAYTNWLSPYATPMLEVWNDVIGGRVARIEFACNDEWTNADIWMELSYHDSSGGYQCVSTRVANPLIHTGASYPISSVTWSDSPSWAQYMAISFTADQVGLLQARVFFTGPGVFVNPVLLLS